MTSNFSEPPRSYQEWAATTGLALEQEINGWMAKCQSVEAERDALRAERDDLIKEFGQFKNEQRAFRSQIYTERDALRAENERLKADDSVTYRSRALLAEDALDAARAEIERLRQERDDAIDAEKIALREIGAENQRLRAALEEIYAGGEVSMRAWHLALIAAKALGRHNCH